jgi:ribosomal protein L14E/L6E/L27E
MAPKSKASAPAHLVITGRVKGPPKISQEGSAVVVKKTLDDGATVQETFPRRRVRGKQVNLQQLIPAEEVLRTIEEATEAVASTARAEGERKLSGLQALANRVVDQKVGEEKARTRFQRGKAAAAKSATKAAKGAARTYRRQLNENTREWERTLDNVKRRVTQHLGADAVNEAVRSAYNA